MKKVYTIGYEGKSIDEFIEELKKQGVKNIIDVRIRAGSRKKGFSKTALSEYLNNAGITYNHHKELGTPRYLMDDIKSNGHYEMDAYDEYISENIEIIENFISDTDYELPCLMCYEKKPEECHRSVVANKLSSFTDAEIIHIK